MFCSQIALQDTNLRSTLPESDRTLSGQQCHFNAVFDLEWMPGHMKFVSASGRLLTANHQK